MTPSFPTRRSADLALLRLRRGKGDAAPRPAHRAALRRRPAGRAGARELHAARRRRPLALVRNPVRGGEKRRALNGASAQGAQAQVVECLQPVAANQLAERGDVGGTRSEEHTSELQSLMRTPYA